MTHMSLHGELLRIRGSCSISSGCSLYGPFRLQPVLTVSRRLDGRSPHQGVSLSPSSVIDLELSSISLLG